MQSFSGQKRMVFISLGQIFESNGLAQSVEVMKARRENSEQAPFHPAPIDELVSEKVLFP